MYGLLGKKLGHSYSKVIHEQMLVEKYELLSLNEDELDEFLQQKKFNFVNVTIPYKQTVIPYLDEIDYSAKKIGAVNLIVNRNNKLIGYNTDYYGLLQLIKKSKIQIEDKNCLILGTGGTSKTACAVLEYLNAKTITFASRTKSDNVVTYQELTKATKANYQVIVNTTPVGMYPDIDNSPISLDDFSSLEGVVDVIYNPIRTQLIQDANERGINAVSGLEMLIYQAAKAEEIFFEKQISTELLNKIYQKILLDKLNIVLIGMPGVGKTTIGKILEQELGKQLIDVDEEIEKKVNMSIPNIFEKFKEPYFRKLEAETIKEVALNSNTIIATGGGAILNYNNVLNLKANGIVILIERDLDNILITNNRPLTKSKEELLALAATRMPLYQKAQDVTLTNIDIATPTLVSNYVMNKIGEFLKGEQN